MLHDYLTQRGLAGRVHDPSRHADAEADPDLRRGVQRDPRPARRARHRALARHRWSPASIPTARGRAPQGRTRSSRSTSSSACRCIVRSAGGGRVGAHRGRLDRGRSRRRSRPGFPACTPSATSPARPVPRAGVIAEGEASTVADVLVAQIKGGPTPAPFAGEVICYIEMGDRHRSARSTSTSCPARRRQRCSHRRRSRGPTRSARSPPTAGGDGSTTTSPPCN